MLSAQVLFIAWKRDWRLLLYLSFGATFYFFTKAIFEAFDSSQFWLFFGFLTGYFILFSTSTFIFQYAKKQRATILELLFLSLNAFVYTKFGMDLIRETFAEPNHALATMTLSIALFYLVHIGIFKTRERLSSALMMSFTGLACFFLAITFPLVFSKGWITIAWSIQAFITLWMAHRLNSSFLKYCAHTLYLITVWRLFLLDLNTNFFNPTNYEWTWRAFLDRALIFGIPTLSLLATNLLFSKSNDDSESAAQITRTYFWVSLLAAFSFINLEMWTTISRFHEQIRPIGISLVWIAFGFLLIREIRTGSKLAIPITWILTIALLSKVFIFDLATLLTPQAPFLFVENSVKEVLYRVSNFGITITFLIIVWKIALRKNSSKLIHLAKPFGYTALACTLAYSSLEVWNALHHYLPNFTAGGISIFWAMFAMALLLAGVIRSLPIFRGLGLGLLSLVIIKIFFVDLAELDPIYRIIAFIILGVIVLLGSFLYIRNSSRFTTG